MSIEVSVPSLLADCTGGRSRFRLEADTLEDALERLLGDYPLLRHHLYRESGELRPHVLLYYNDQNIAWLADRRIPLREGDRLLVLQAVSGG
ncbi:MoaD/ThiS family protein [Paenibacillus humicola]|uniref:MoaD/ThiS family protein n=1 Tax=Paenibacillus humicola TaxID=3110540 RepID=UPI00237BA91F|nr:MoaD/ThiS family protein [Paenibacillus humicola]